MQTKNGYQPEVSRCVGGGLSVSIRREDYSTHRYASAANLNRILLRVGRAADFLIITPSKATIPLSENHKRFETMPNLVRSLIQSKRIDAYWLVGHWTDDGDVSEPSPHPVRSDASEHMDCLEYSWLLVKRDKKTSSSDWLLTATLLASEYEQHAFIIHLDGETTLRSSVGNVWEILESDEQIKSTWASLARLRARSEPYGYVAVLKNLNRHQEPRSTANTEPMSCEGDSRKIPDVSSYAVRGNGDCHSAEFFLAVTGNISSKMHFDALGVNDLLPNDHDSRSPWNYPTPAQLYAAKWIRGKSL